MASMRTEPESWSGVIMQASTTSTRARAAVDLAQRLHAVEAMALEHALPALEEHLAVDHLVALHALGLVGARADALVVNDGALRLVVHALARRAHPKRQVGVLVIGRGVGASRNRPAPPSRCAAPARQAPEQCSASRR
jgi:hypothetical protein